MVVLGRWQVLGLSTASVAAAVAVGVAAPTPVAHRASVKFQATAVAYPTTTPPPPPVNQAGMQVVALGDSVLSARRCGCSGALTEYSRLLDARTHHPALMVNAADGPATSSSVLDQLTNWATLGADIRTADMVVLMVGANDFDDAFVAVTRGADPSSTYRPVADRLQRNVIEIVQRVRSLRGAQIPVQVLGYWNDFRDGKVAASQYSAAKRAAAATATAATNAALQGAAATVGATFVPLVAAFTSQRGDPTSFLEDDGNHPDEAGNELIAAALFHAWMATPAARWPAA